MMNNYDRLLDLFCDKSSEMYSKPYHSNDGCVYAAREHAFIKIPAAMVEPPVENHPWFPIAHVLNEYAQTFKVVSAASPFQPIIWKHEAIENAFMGAVPDEWSYYKFNHIHLQDPSIDLLLEAMDTAGLNIVTQLTNRPGRFNLFSLGICFILLTAVIPSEHDVIINIDELESVVCAG